MNILFMWCRTIDLMTDSVMEIYLEINNGEATIEIGLNSIRLWR